eukprot:2709551-Prorocentrum_lima.AAC.1
MAAAPWLCTFEEVWQDIQTTKDSAAGEDGITMGMLRCLPAVMIGTLARTFNSYIGTSLALPVE